MPADTGRDAYTFLKDLRVWIDGDDVTDNIVNQLEERDGAGSWKTLGDGKATHPLCIEQVGGKVQGTGEIDLIRLGVDLTRVIIGLS
jgi:hypothetical protein